VRFPAPSLLALVLLGPLSIALFFTATAQERPAPTAASEVDPLSARGYSVTSGAAPGYVQDVVCRGCHTDLFDSYQEVGMARSFFKTRAETAIEDFQKNRFVHEPSGRHYEMSLSEDGQYRFRRWEENEAGEAINVFETDIAWILGSGNHSRTYLYRAGPDDAPGELYQLPLAWYSQSGTWGMAPGYDRSEHQGLLRRVRRECMFCHNAYPEVPEGSDHYWSPQGFPASLPEGTGCQRCHGPGADHVRIALSENFDFDALRAAIVNPGNLPAQRRDDVCYECHLQPSVVLSGVRRFGRGDYSFRPGESLAEYIVPLDVEEQGRAKRERFEINHHPYRLEQSRCFIESAQEASAQTDRSQQDRSQQTSGLSAMSCLTCHDPHQKVPVENRQEHYRKACQSCHQLDDCQLEAMGESRQSLPEELRAVPAGNCISCHMQDRRTQDVIQVFMTDHLIRRSPGGEELMAPRVEEDPVLIGATFMDQERAPEGDLGEIYRTAAVVRAGGLTAVGHLNTLLTRAKPRDVEPYLDLARGYLKRKRWDDVQRTLDALEENTKTEGSQRDPSQQALILEWRGLARSGQGDLPSAIDLLRRSLDLSPRRPEGWFNLGHLLLRSRRPEESLEPFAKAISLRTNLAPAWFHQGNALQILGRPDEAIASYRRTLELDPKLTNGYLALSQTLNANGQRNEAIRIARHGAQVAAQPERVQQLVEALEALPAEDSAKNH